MSEIQPLVAKARQPRGPSILEGLRAQIVSGKLPPGTQLPSTRELVGIWKCSYFIAHTALTALTREGWLDRQHGAGTFIADPRRRFTCAAIYHSSQFAENDQNSFGRSLHFALLRAFERLNKQTQIFIDGRTESKRHSLLPALREGIREQRIQCVAAPTLDPSSEMRLARLRIPTAFMSNQFSQNRVDFDLAGMFREAFHRLKASGCRSVGIITSLSGGPGTYALYHDIVHSFEQLAADEDLGYRPAWFRYPSGWIDDLERYGYAEFRHLWKGREKPDGLIVYPDITARGVILAILEAGPREVTRQMKLFFHRNSQTRLLCPIPATWAISDEKAMAECLVGILQRQFDGEKITPSLIPYRFESVQTL